MLIVAAHRTVSGYEMSVPAEQPKTAEPWASVHDVAKHLGVAEDSIYRWIERRGLPAHKISRLWKFKLTEVDCWVRASGADENRRRGPL